MRREPPSRDACTITVRVTPRGGRSAVIGVRAADGVLLVRVAAPPVEGAANRACLQLLAETLGIRRTDVTLDAGERSRDKRFRISGWNEARRDAWLATLPRIGGADGAPA